MAGVGDSNTATGASSGLDWVNEAGRKYGGWTAWRNVSQGGRTLLNMIDILASTVDPLYIEPGPGVVIVLGGINDATAGADAATIAGRMETFCDSCYALGWDRVIVCTYPCPGGYMEMPAANNLIRAGWSGYADGLVDLAVAPNIGEAADHNNPIYFSDPIHMTYEGLSIVSDSVAKEMRLLVWP